MARDLSFITNPEGCCLGYCVHIIITVFSWLHDTDSHQNFGPNLLLKVLMFNMHEIWSFD